MDRRQFLTVSGANLSILLSGCTQSPGNGDGTPSSDVPVRITGRADQPAAPVDYGVEMVTSVATPDRPARLRVSVTNPSDRPVVLGEERAVQFHHVTSLDDALYLHPAGEETWDGPVNPGCWQLTEYVAVPEYYGTIPLDAGETTQADAYVYGHPDLPASTCLPEGDHHLRTSGMVGNTEEAVVDDTDATEFTWEFTVRIGE